MSNKHERLWLVMKLAKWSQLEIGGIKLRDTVQAGSPNYFMPVFTDYMEAKRFAGEAEVFEIQPIT